MRERLTLQRISRAVCPLGKAQAFMFDTEMPRLAVRVTETGAKSFVFEAKLNRQTIRRTIGACSAWKLDDARIEANRLQRMIDKGIDPREHDLEQKTRKAEQKAEEERARKEAEHARKYTLRALCEAYASHLEGQGKAKSASSVRSAFKCHVFDSHPELANTPAREVTAHQVAAVVREVIEAGKDRTAGLLRSCLSAAFNCARRSPFDAKLPAAFIKFEIESNPVDPVATIAVKPRNRTLSTSEMKGYLEALADGLIDQALKLALYAGGQRMAQLLRAEIKDFDPGTKVLRLMDPKGRRTAPREHLLPLAAVATEIVAGLVERAKLEGSTYLFGSRGAVVHWSSPGKRVQEISAAQGGESYDLRDIRRTAETMLAGLGISRDIRAQLLSHGISGVQAAHYDRHSYIEEKRSALRTWEKHLESIISGQRQKILNFK